MSDKAEYAAGRLLLVLTVALTCSCMGERLVLSAGNASETAIIVDFGPYYNCASAAGSENRIAWNSRDKDPATICTEAFAAMQLRSYLCKIVGLNQNDSTMIPILKSGEKLPEVENIILVGKVCGIDAYRGLHLEIDSESDEAFLIRSCKLNNKKIIAVNGKSRKGTLYGVYHLLNVIGCRWYAPGNENEVIPHKEELVFTDLDIQRQPAADTRGFWVSNGKVEAEVNDMTWEGRLTDRGTKEFFLWMARNGLNFFWNREKHWRFMKKLGIELTAGEHVTYYELLRPDQTYPYDHPLFDGDDDLPEDPYPVGVEYGGDANDDGRLSYAEAHPEWYGMTGNGKRFFPVNPFGTNYCTSNQSGTEELLKNITGYLRDGIGRNADTFSFWPLDGGEWCSCPECMAQNANATDRLLEMAYKIRKELNEAYREGRIDRDIPVHSLIYVQTKALPSRALPADFDYDKIVLTYFPIGRCYAHNFNDTLCTEINRRYNKVLLEWLSDSCLYKGKLLLGEYYNISGFRDLSLVFKITMANDIPYYLNSGFSGMHYMHHSVDEMGVRRLINYQMAKMLWDPDLDMDQLLEDYFQNFYGPSASGMKEFYCQLETAVANVKAWRYYLRPRINAVAAGRADSIFPLPRISNHLHYEDRSSATNDALDWKPMMEETRRCRATLDQVLETDLPPDIQRRIEEDEYGFRYLELSTSLFDSLIELITVQNSHGAERENALRKALLASESLKRYRIKSPALGVANAYEATDLVEACRILLDSEVNRVPE
ncbi:DUF4838 domain-containing protein [Gemmatimonadota bacterium]